MLTKTGQYMVKEAGLWSSISKAEAQGVGPLSLGLGGWGVYKGDTSVGGAIGGTVAAVHGYNYMDKLLHPTTRGPLLNKVFSGMSRLPSWMGTAGRIGAAMTAGAVAGGIGESFGNKVAPIWRRKKPGMPPDTETVNPALMHGNDGE